MNEPARKSATHGTQRLMARYTQDQTVTNAVLKLPSSVVVHPKSKTGSWQGDK